jgi:hypothetical protein
MTHRGRLAVINMSSNYQIHMGLVCHCAHYT